MYKQFKDVAVGTQFKYKEELYTKIPDERKTCCFVQNAQKQSDNHKVMILPLENVEVFENNETV